MMFLMISPHISELGVSKVDQSLIFQGCSIHEELSISITYLEYEL